MSGHDANNQDVGFEGQLVDPIRCASCQSDWMVSDLEFPEPDDGSNTQFGWLAARCLGCRADMQVSWDKVSHVFD
jgi:hypothetical protein